MLPILGAEVVDGNLGPLVFAGGTVVIDDVLGAAGIACDLLPDFEFGGANLAWDLPLCV